MKKWMKISLGGLGGIVLLSVIDLICIFTINRPIFAVKLKKPYAYGGIFYDVYNCPEYSLPQIKSKGTKFFCTEDKEENNITLEDINEIIIDYISNDKNDKDNYVHNYIDTKKNKVVVGLVDNTVKKQEEFISKVFSNCCGSLYIKYIKENSMIEFEETKYTFEAKIIETKENEIIVKVLKDTQQFKKNDEVRMKIARPTNGTNDFYVVGNNVKITAKGIILTSKPAQIDVINIELAS